MSGNAPVTHRIFRKGRTIMTPGHEVLIITAFTMIGLLGILSFAMVARYRKEHNEYEELNAEQVA